MDTVETDAPAPPPPPTPPPRPASAARPWTWPLHWQILLGLVIGAGIGLGLGAWAVGRIDPATPAAGRGAAGGAIVTATVAYTLLKLGGDLFLRALQMIIVPLVVSSIVLAMANLGGQKDFGRLGLKTLAYYLATTLAAVLTGLVLVDLVAPGVSGGVPILRGQDLSAFADAGQAVADKTGGKTGVAFLDVFRQMVPPNVFGAASDNGQLLGLIVVALVVGYFSVRLVDGPRETFLSFVQAVYDVTLMVTDLVLRFTPIGVLGLIAATVAEQYARLWPDARFGAFLAGIATFAAVVMAGLLIHFLVTMPLILAFVARVNPLLHYRAMAPAMVTAFSTSSSSATLPLTIDCTERRAGVSNRIAGFTLPMGATVNMDGTALYECVAAVFICQAFGVELSFAQQFMIVVIALLTSIGVASVPSASLVAIAVILQAVQQQLPPGANVDLLAGMALLFVFDRPLDMSRTVVNIFGDSVGAVTVARSEGEATLLVAGAGGGVRRGPTAVTPSRRHAVNPSISRRTASTLSRGSGKAGTFLTTGWARHSAASASPLAIAASADSNRTALLASPSYSPRAAAVWSHTTAS